MHFKYEECHSLISKVQFYTVIAGFPLQLQCCYAAQMYRLDAVQTINGRWQYKHILRVGRQDSLVRIVGSDFHIVSTFTCHFT